jgi:uncharacterized protein YjeT (DUF2065 family)
LGAAQNFRLAGSIGSDLRLWEVNSLNLGPAAAIGGDLIYKSPQQAQIASGARVGGETRWEQGAADPIKPQQQVSWPSLLMWFAAGVVLWGLGYLLFPSLWQGLASALEEAPGASIGWGILLLVATPFIFVILLITVIGIPVALILLLAYILLLYLSKIILGDILGRYLLRSFKWEGRFSMWIGFMMGFALVILLSKIPIVGILITLAAAIIALGCTALSIFDSRRRSRPDPAQ